ncbi:MAG: ImmA/IrrE family metallo-endopeptidase, partial [Candidatus Dormibacteria bacterium]
YAVLAPVFRPAARKGGAEPEDDRPVGFRWVTVFDVSQTEGPELPAPVGQMPSEAPPEILERLLALVPSLGFTVEFTELRSGRRGDCSHALRRIRVDRRLSPGPRVKTLGHELAHAILHGPDFTGGRELAELEAESVAYVVCQQLGLDSSAYSFGYVASWAGSGPVASRQISRSGQRILRAAAEISGARDASSQPVATRLAVAG